MFLDQDNAAALSEQAEDVLYKIADEMGLVMTEAEAESLLKFADATSLNEAQNIVRLNKQSKLNALSVRAALVIAQQRKDPIYLKYARASQLKRTFRTLIVKKYGSQATVTARKLLANAGKRNLVDVSSSRLGNPESKR